MLTLYEQFQFLYYRTAGTRQTRRLASTPERHRIAYRRLAHDGCQVFERHQFEVSLHECIILLLFHTNHYLYLYYFIVYIIGIQRYNIIMLIAYNSKGLKS